MLGRLALLFVVVPILELVLLIQLGQWVGLGPTLALIVGTGVIGAALARAEGLRALARFREEVARGSVPGGPVLDGLAVLVGAAFLLTPGLLTDLTGFLLLLPPTRRWLVRRVTRGLERAVEDGRVQVFGLGGFGQAPFVRPDPELDPRHEIDQNERD